MIKLINKLIFHCLLPTMLITVISINCPAEETKKNDRIIDPGASYKNTGTEKLIVISEKAFNELFSRAQAADKYEQWFNKFEPLLAEKQQKSDELLASSDKMSNIQNESYATLHDLFTDTSEQVKQSTENTDKALQLLASLKVQTYIIAGIAGGVTGGFIVGDENSRFNPWGGAVGLASGLLLNFLCVGL